MSFGLGLPMTEHLIIAVSDQHIFESVHSDIIPLFYRSLNGKASRCVNQKFCLIQIPKNRS